MKGVKERKKGMNKKEKKEKRKDVIVQQKRKQKCTKTKKNQPFVNIQNRQSKMRD